MGSTERPKAVVVALDPSRMGSTALVAGLPLAVRAVLELGRAGVESITLLITDEAVGRQLMADPRIAVPVEVVRAESLADLPAVMGDEVTVVVPAEVVMHRDGYRALVAAASEAALVVCEAPGWGPFTGTRTLARELAEGRAALAEHRVERVPWVHRADDATGRRRIVDDLFEGCRKDVDGIVSRHLNRHVSIFISKRIVDAPLSPNAITLVTLLLGLVGAVVTTRASYGSMVVGAALLQLNSILDGVDGELARVRFQHSKLGQWLDTVCDDVANTSFYVGTTVAAFALTSLPAWLPWCGVVAVAGSMLTMAMYYAELIRLGSGDFYALDVGQSEERSGWWGALNRVVRYATKRDFFVFSFLVAALLGILPYLLPVMAVGTMVTTVMGVRITAARFRAPPTAR